MTRNEALEKIKQWTMGDDYSVNDHDAILRFFENELGMSHIKETSLPTHYEYVFKKVKIFGWDEEK
jgi:hypothetical protein